MGRNLKYTIEDLYKVKYLFNNGLSKVEAIKKSGFSDTSLYYSTLKRNKLTEVMDFKEK